MWTGPKSNAQVLTKAMPWPTGHEHHRIKEHLGFIECSCGATFAQPAPGAIRYLVWALNLPAMLFQAWVTWWRGRPNGPEPLPR